MFGEPRVDRPGARPEVAQVLPYTDSHAMAGIEDDLSTVMSLDVLRSNNIGECHPLKEEAARLYGCGVKNDAKAMEVYAEQSGHEEIDGNGHFPYEQVRETCLRCHEQAQGVEADEAEERHAPGPLVCQMFVCHRPVLRRRRHDSGAIVHALIRRVPERVLPGAHGVRLGGSSARVFKNYGASIRRRPPFLK